MICPHCGEEITGVTVVEAKPMLLKNMVLGPLCCLCHKPKGWSGRPTNNPDEPGATPVPPVCQCSQWNSILGPHTPLYPFWAHIAGGQGEPMPVTTTLSQGQEAKK